MLTVCRSFSLASIIENIHNVFQNQSLIYSSIKLPRHSVSILLDSPLIRGLTKSSVVFLKKQYLKKMKYKYVRKSLSSYDLNWRWAEIFSTFQVLKWSSTTFVNYYFMHSINLSNASLKTNKTSFNLTKLNTC